jgi:RNA polymerase sigma factor (sigma-70 family)
MNDNKLVKLCLENNVTAKQALHARFYGKMLPVCLRYIEDKEEAKEVLKEGFLNVFKTLRHYKGDIALAVWVKDVIIQTVVEKIRNDRMNRLIVSTVHVAKDVKAEKCKELSVDEIISRATADDLLKALHALISSYRIVFNLNIVDGYSHTDISNMLKISEETSMSNLEKAKYVFQNNLTQQLTTADGK